jgi:RimJ/RimL family protein N-acetyltransferase
MEPIILETVRLIIRPIAPGDTSEVFAYRSDREANRYQGWIPECTEDVEQFISKVSKQIDEPETWFQFVLIEKESENIIGDAGVHFFGKENRQVELGCTLSKDFQKKGYATEALRKLIDFVFNDLNKHRIIVSIDPANSHSIRLAERLGFRKEAHFRESLWINGQWVDDVIYAILKEEWLNSTNKLQ